MYDSEIYSDYVPEDPIKTQSDALPPKFHPRLFSTEEQEELDLWWDRSFLLDIGNVDEFDV